MRSRDHWIGYGDLLSGSNPSADGKSWTASGKDHIHPSPASITAYAVGLKSKLDTVELEVDINDHTSAKAAHPSAEVGRSSVTACGRCQISHPTLRRPLGTCAVDGILLSARQHHGVNGTGSAPLGLAAVAVVIARERVLHPRQRG